MTLDDQISALRAEFAAELAAVRAESAARIDALERQRDRAEERITQLEAGHQAAGSQSGPARLTRRALVLGGVGAAAGAMAGVAGAAPATAGTGAMQYGAANNAGGSSTSLRSTNGVHGTFFVSNDGAGPAAYCYANGAGAGLFAQSAGLHGVHGYARDWFGVYGQAVGTGDGVVGDATSGAGVHGRSGSGAGVHASSGTGAALWLENRDVRTGPPVGGPYAVGQMVAPTDGSLWVCVQAGSPGRWRLLASTESAGAFVPITPTRVYDSRQAQPSGGAALVPGSPRNISVADGRDLNTGAVTVPNLIPAQTMAVALNLTATGAPGSGWVALAPGGALRFSASAINFQPNQAVANGLVTAINPATRAVKAWASTSEVHVIIDICGYFRAT